MPEDTDTPPPTHTPPFDPAPPGRAGPLGRLRNHRVFDAARGDGLKALAIRGSAWTVLGYGGGQALRLASNIILTRLLFPEAFGLMALVAVFMQGLTMFSDVGIGPSIIRTKRGEDTDFLNSAWTVQIMRGAILWLGCCAFAWPIAQLYDEPLVLALLPVVGLTAVINGFRTTAFYTSNRKLDLGRLTSIQFVGQAVGVVAMIAWALIEPTVWALAGGGLVGSAATLWLGFRLMPAHRHTLRWEPEAIKELFGFGKWIFISTALTFLATQADRMVMPLVFDTTMLAFYALAIALVVMPLRIVNMLAKRVMFPAYSRVFRDGDTAALSRTTRKFSTTLAPAYCLPLGMLFFGQALIDLLYDPRYATAGDLLTILAIGGYIDMMRASQSGVLLAAGNSKGAMVVNAVRLGIGLPASILLGLDQGPMGFCVGQVIAAIAALLVQRRLAAAVLLETRVRVDEILLGVLFLALVGKTLWAVSITA